ncbi:leucine-rich repeat domain-containing protein [Treponema denticola]|uniref:Leucine-rich repeat domain-containing protein n=1 Tax=Treponema denticola TaxID=158 RepID=A0A9Q9BL59_TREDN|nr:leucine-rich repeat domain-containing protein [Treponema denticola]UTC90062.1 leucine-rich repeat domain-containing protein [Treponema denticola]UTD00585.1 leucine-rich repeat domain-containing protein [Treponema denticola]
MTKSKTHKKKGAAAIITAAVLVLIALFGMAACSNAAQPGTGDSAGASTPKYTITFGVGSGLGTLKAQVDGKELNSGDQVEKGETLVFTAEPAQDYVLGQWTNAGTVIGEASTNTSYNYTVTANADIKVKFQAPFIEGGASLILSPDKLDIEVRVRTSDDTPVTVEGCTETELQSGTQTTTLHAKGTRVILKGKITDLDCRYLNRLTALNVQGCTALRYLSCYVNQLTALNVQGLTALQGLSCQDNQLTELNVQGCTALQGLESRHNKLIALNVQGCTALRYLSCWNNQLTDLNVQGLTALRSLVCDSNRLTALNVQDLPALQGLSCGDNQLTALNVQGCTALRYLSCCVNQLNADAFKKLFDDLPQRQDSDDAKCILYTEKNGVTEGNHTDFTAPSDLADSFNNVKTVKKWKMYKYNAGWNMVEL